jgi:hypothetical protein
MAAFAHKHLLFFDLHSYFLVALARPAVTSAVATAVVIGTMRIVTAVATITAAKIKVSRPGYWRPSGNQLRQNGYDETDSNC